MPDDAPVLKRVLLPLLSDRDGYVRALATRTLGEKRVDTAVDAVAPLLKDPEPRVRFFAALSLGKLGRREAGPALLEMLRANGDQDVYLRHAGVMALTWLKDFELLDRAATDPSAAVRRAVLLADRRLARPEVSGFLHDPDTGLVTEAARAINDAPVNGAMMELAGLLTNSMLPEPALRRALNAAFRVGTKSSAEALGRFAALTNASVALRVEAVNALRDWPEPSGRDRVMGLWRPIPAPRDAGMAREAFQRFAVPLLQDTSARIQSAAIEAAARLNVSEVTSALMDLAKHAELDATVRVGSLRALARLQAPLDELLDALRADRNETVRRAVLEMEGQTSARGGLEKIAHALTRGSIGEQQSALALLAKDQSAGGVRLLKEWMDRLLAGNVPAGLELDIIEAATARNSPELKAQLDRYESQAADDPLAGFRVALHGGDAGAGRKVFFERADAACLRCHKVDAEGGEVGPNLNGVGARQNRAYLLEAIVAPNQAITPGFESLVIGHEDGTVYAGVLKGENDQEVVLTSLEDGVVTVPKPQIKFRQRGLSAMPEGLANLLSKREVRDLVEFLSSLKY